MTQGHSSAGSSVSNYRDIIAHDIPVIDVRSPTEFAQGAIPSARNLPILNDDHRAQVGREYKQSGRDAAYELGMRLVSGNLRESRICGWLDFIRKQPSALLCCWRGGLRSSIAQAWLQERGCEVPVLAGGSKALRHFCLEQLAQAAGMPMILLSGRTGAGKTDLLKQVGNSIDLEGLARHRGSAFGQLPTAQPQQVCFDASLVQSMLRSEFQQRVLVEDESRNIGRLSVPDGFFEAMRIAPIVVLQVPDQDRVATTLDVYVKGGSEEGLLASLDRIKNRLGGEMHARIRTLMAGAFQMKDDDQHREWISLLFAHYYDRMYDYQLRQKADRIIFRGNRAEVLDMLKHTASRREDALA